MYALINLMCGRFAITFLPGTVAHTFIALPADIPLGVLFVILPNRFCVYPQEVVLKLREPVLLRKLQILSHQYLVGRSIIGLIIFTSLDEM